MTVAEKLLPEFDEEFASSRRFLVLVPNDKLLWKPHEKSMELGRLAWHLADFPEWTVVTFTRDHYAMTAEEGDKAMFGWKGKSREDILARFDGDLPVARAAMAGASDAEMAHRWTMEWAGHTIIDDPREIRLSQVDHQPHGAPPRAAGCVSAHAGRRHPRLLWTVCG